MFPKVNNIYILVEVDWSLDFLGSMGSVQTSKLKVSQANITSKSVDVKNCWRLARIERYLSTIMGTRERTKCYTIIRSIFHLDGSHILAGPLHDPDLQFGWRRGKGWKVSNLQL